MANEVAFNGVAFAIGTQTGFGSVHTATKNLSGALTVANGIILGDKNSGDAESGITLPNHSAIIRENAQIAGTFTQQADDFLREVVEGLEITFPLKGNGADAGAPDAGAAQPDAGIDALLGCAGLIGANGAGAPDYKYTPRASTEYATIHLWVADMDFILQDCLVSQLGITLSASGAALIKASIAVGSVESANDGVTFPTFTWGQQAALAAPPVVGVNHAIFGQTRGFQGDLSILIDNVVEEFTDSNVATTGVRQSQTERIITASGRVFLHTSDSVAERTNLTATTAPTDDLTLQLGTADVGGVVTELNAALINVNNLQCQTLKYDRTGADTVCEFSGKATGTGAGGNEFMLEYN